MPTTITDTHTHLGDPVFDPDRRAVLDRARAAGIDAIILVAETLADARRDLELARRHAILYPAAGLYPEHLDAPLAEEMTSLIRRHQKELVAIGEVGLDYWVVKDAAGRSLQREIFDGFIRLAAELDLPLNVHSRSAGRHLVDMLLKRNAPRVQLHAFDAKVASALPAVEAGYFFSIPPSVIRSRQKQKLIKALPLTCLLLETDSPILGPVPGQRNEPANIKTVIEAIAGIKGVTQAEVVETAAANTRRLYGDIGGHKESAVHHGLTETIPTIPTK